MFLVNYSSSSDSEDEKSRKEFKNGMLANIQKERVLLPQPSTLLGKRKHEAVDNVLNDDPSQHDGRLRSFKHERGNWASYVYIPVNNDILEDLQDICHSHIGDKMNFRTSTEMHISLTKTVVMQYHFIESFVGTLQTATKSLESFTVSFDNLKVYTNSERTRTFLALKVGELYFDKMSNILQKIDPIMKDFKLATFYENPSFHVSIIWCTGDHAAFLEGIVPTILESLKERLPLYFRIDQIYCKIGFKEFCFKLK